MITLTIWIGKEQPLTLRYDSEAAARQRLYNTMDDLLEEDKAEVRLRIEKRLEKSEKP